VTQCGPVWSGAVNSHAPDMVGIETILTGLLTGRGQPVNFTDTFYPCPYCRFGLRLTKLTFLKTTVASYLHKNVEERCATQKQRPGTGSRYNFCR